jgi:tRNA U38,U39,U40 pseudouridine synthase TruA
VRGRLKEEEMSAAFQEGKFDIPKAPSLGLLLEDVSPVSPSLVWSLLARV